MTRRSLVIIATVGLSLVVGGTVDANFRSDLRAARRHEIVQNRPLALAGPIKTIQMKAMDSRSPNENSLGSAAIFDCLQLQVIDEVELLGETECVQ